MSQAEPNFKAGKDKGYMVGVCVVHYSHSFTLLPSRPPLDGSFHLDL